MSWLICHWRKGSTVRRWVRLLKYPLFVAQRFGITPTISSPNPGITRILLLSMGLIRSSYIINEPFSDEADCEWAAADAVDEDKAREHKLFPLIVC